MKTKLNLPALCLLVLAGGTSHTAAQITTFTYQGRLNLTGAPASGLYDFMFRLMTDPTNGAAAPVIPINLAVPVTNGLFTTGMDFGVENFIGANRWLEINVRTNSGGSFTTLSPRQLLTPTPYAITANTASNLLGALPASQISGTILNASLPSNPSFSGTVTANNFSGNGADLTNVNATSLGGLNNSSLWRTIGNAGTTAGTHFLGTTDTQPLEIKVNSLRVLRFEDNGDGDDTDSTPDGAPNVIGGSPYNLVDGDWVGVFIGGGGATNYDFGAYTNRVSANFGIIVGGRNNTVQASESIIGGGFQNTIGNNSLWSTIPGGLGNTISSNAHESVIAGGSYNNIGAGCYSSAVGGGDHNTIESSAHCTIAGGVGNGIAGAWGAICGGEGNYIAEGSAWGVIAGGFLNNIAAGTRSSAIGGGDANTITASSAFSTIAGGQFNTIGTNTDWSVIGGGHNNLIAPNCSSVTIPGGENNTIWSNADGSIIAGGGGNEIGTNSSYAVIGGGLGNIIMANSSYAMIPGGQSNTATNGAFAAGRYAKAVHTGAFVWADSSFSNPFDIASTNANSVTMRAAGGYRLFSDQFATAGVFLAPGSGSWTAMSDRNAKENFRVADACAVLEKVVALPLQTWNYKSQDAGIRHIGPMAQDFKAAFQLGESDTGIATVDADGVALAAIQGLNQKVENLNGELKRRAAENAELKQELGELKQLMNSLAHKLSGGAQ